MTYSSAAVEQSLNWIRLRIGDTDSNDQQLADAEIQTMLDLHGSRIQAAGHCALAIAAKYTRFGAMKESEAFNALATQI